MDEGNDESKETEIVLLMIAKQQTFFCMFRKLLIIFLVLSY